MSTTKFFHQAQFLLSAPTYQHLPADEGQEVLFIGRSNVGKSSLFNALTESKIARTSKTPGRTQAFNCFTLTPNIRLIDMPGMGFAKTSEKQKKQWHNMLIHYLVHRQSLRGVILVSDIRHPLLTWDKTLLSACQGAGHPLHIVLNKSDKLSKQACTKTLQDYQNTLPKLGYQFTDLSIQTSSTSKRIGMDSLRTQLMQWLTMGH